MMTGTNSLYELRKVFAEHRVKLRGTTAYHNICEIARGADWPTCKALMHNVKPVDRAINARAQRYGRGPDGRTA